MDAQRETCGPKFLSALSHFTAQTRDPVQLFSAGHMTGQAEKIYLGACAAAMFRPSTEYSAWALQAAVYLSGLYGLQVNVFARDEIKDEIWLHRAEHEGGIRSLQSEEYNSPAWHYLRGLLCGVPLGQIDPEFHLRSGFMEPCDKISKDEED